MMAPEPASTKRGATALERQGLGGPVDRHSEFRDEPDDRGDVDDGARARFDEAWRNGAGKAGNRRRVEGDQLGDIIDGLIDERAFEARAGIVDENPDPMIVAQTGLHRRKLIGFGDIGLQDVDRYAGFLAKSRRESLQPCLIARDQYEIVPTTGETVCIGRSDTRGGAGDEDGGSVSHCLVLFRMSVI